ncbi:MAG: hypothetical protein ABI587_10620 [Gemmatimonadales bacterium]
MRTPIHSRLYLVVGLCWLLGAIGLAASGQLEQLRPPVPQLVVLGLTIALVAAGATVPGFRVWLAGLNLRQIVALHITRFVGIYFLVLYGRGELPYAFAVPGGWGDILVATGALILVLLVPDLLRRRPWLLAWNLFGLFDILYVVATAARLAFADPSSMQSLLRLPLSLLPTFLVPLIIASHVYLFGRLRAERSQPAM